MLGTCGIIAFNRTIQELKYDVTLILTADRLPSIAPYRN
ncbi:hypothetical protein A33Q_1669 [Indibacter alkaliphilus LW1]|uniref:Uncharacterized protein n=1 Tax=Indibacter alkaliphilus (strain CCUG 57479 / KCTC 22604 / LW1) TaxID=1189612 RepID=S2DKV0_INDAL|nr:hypothetical protein A33Q_1669 [Indibacter alkaliphilus LW1]